MVTMMAVPKMKRLQWPLRFSRSRLFTATVGVPIRSLGRSAQPHPWTPGSMIYAGYCDGTRHRDGTYWHYIQYGIPLIGHPAGLLSLGMQCMLDNGSPSLHRAAAAAGGRWWRNRV